MRVKEIASTYHFYFHTIADIEAFNEWIDETGVIGGKVAIPMGVPPRTLRRVLSKRPSILRADNDHSVELIRGRWLGA